MNFKTWLLQLEAIDANTKDLLLKAKAPKDELDAFVKELEDEPTLIDKKTAFQRFQSKFNIQKKVKDEDGQRQFFANVPNTTEEELKFYDYYKNENPQALREMMELLRKFIDKKLITLKFENEKPVLIRNTLQGEQKFDTPDFTRFMSSLHGIQASLNKFKSKGNYFNPIEEELNHKPNLVAKGDNVWVFKGHAPDVCRIYGKGHPWCISSSTSAAHWFSYRINYHQTQYFVFDFNKDENDPARYVNPGVAPEGQYSEWVDARNQHSTDPEDGNSEVGINGYSSINQYKKYLASKGIPLKTWKTKPPENWEKRLSKYDDNRNFQGAKNDPDPRVFPMYVKIVDKMDDSDFETLDKEQKIEFVLGKLHTLSKKQGEFLKTNIKRSDYYSSLQEIHDKISAAVYLKDESALEKIATMPELEDSEVESLLYYVNNKDKFAEYIINNNLNYGEYKVLQLLRHSNDKDKIAKLIINKKEELDGSDVHNLMSYATAKDEIAELIINKKSNLLGGDVFRLLVNATDKELIAELLQKNTDNISKLTDDYVDRLMSHAEDKDQMAKITIKYKKELSDNNVAYLLSIATAKDEIAELIIEKKSELSDDNVFRLLKDAIDKYKIAELLQQHVDNISKLDYDFVHDLIILYATDRKQMAQILNKYHQKKTPEIQKEIDKYL